MQYEFTEEEMQDILARLSAPFDPKLVKWRVTATNKEKTKGLVAPYADPRAYTLRLNEVLTPAGWTCEFQTTVINGVSSGPKPSPSKLIMVGTLEIYGIGRKSSTGEKNADDPNAGTAAEAQALKRAASQFGLGKYFYDIKEAGVNLWVPVDAKGIPTQVPRLPAWALPPNTKQPGPPPQQGTQPQRQRTQPPQSSGHPQQNGAPRQQGNSQSASTPGQGSGAPTSQAQFEASKQGFLEELGQPLFASIVGRVDRGLAEGKVTGDRHLLLMRKLEDQRKLLRAVRTAAADMPMAALDAALDRYQVKRLDLIPNFAVLYDIAKEFDVLPDSSGKAA